MVVQIAGIRNEDDAKMCECAGVDIVGLLVGQAHNAFEFITKEEARKIRDSLTSAKVSVITHLEDAQSIIDIARFIEPDFLQLHSNIAESEVEKIRKALPDVKLVRVIHIGKDGEIITDYKKMKYADFYFTDSINLENNQVGGTGLTHNFEVDKHLAKILKKPLFIAGGLTSENVKDVINLVMPYGVDANSSCRGKDGFRDKNKVISFVKAAKMQKM